ncbi:MAG: DUF2231 domain-containing protein [Vicinamibacteria bacterium]
MLAKQGLRVLGHPVHVALVHFPIALLSVGPLWDLVAIWLGAAWWRFGFWTLTLGLAASLPTAASGLLDYMTLDRKDAERTAERHLYVILAALGSFGMALVVRGGIVPASPGAQFATLALEVVGVLTLTAGAWLGGELVLRYGIGRVEGSSPGTGRGATASDRTR